MKDTLRWQSIAWGRILLGRSVARGEWEALNAWRGLIHQAYSGQPMQPNLCHDLWHQGRFQSPFRKKAFFTPNRREREPSSHHYGHDIQLKRYCGLPLVGAPLPVLLEHGLKVAESSRFEVPKAWAKQGYLCMGPLRAHWLQKKHAVPANPIGPWIRFAKPLLTAEQLQRHREHSGKTLLVVLAHSWDQVERSMDVQACIDAIRSIAVQSDYRRVVWLRHWKDPLNLPLPDGWITACNGHRSNPWFLDALRTLLELSDGLASNAFGTHLGYAVALKTRLHWIDVTAEQDLRQLPTDKAKEEQAEWQERQRLSGELRMALQLPLDQQTSAVHQLLDPYWGLSIETSSKEIAELLGR